MTSNISWENYTQWKGTRDWPQRCWGRRPWGRRPHGSGSLARHMLRWGWWPALDRWLFSHLTGLLPKHMKTRATWRQTPPSRQSPGIQGEKMHHHFYQHSTTDCNTSKSLKCEEHTNSQSGRPCCFHGTSPVRNSTRRGLPWSRGRKTQRWWRRTRLRRSSPRLGINVRGSLPYRWEHQSRPDGAWEQQHKEAETLEREASDNTALTSMISAILPLSLKFLEL